MVHYANLNQAKDISGVAKKALTASSDVNNKDLLKVQKMMQPLVGLGTDQGFIFENKIEGTSSDEIQFQLPASFITVEALGDTNPKTNKTTSPVTVEWGAYNSTGESKNTWIFNKSTKQVSYRDALRGEEIYFDFDSDGQAVFTVNGKHLTQDQMALVCDLRHRLETAHTYYDDNGLVKLSDVHIEMHDDGKMIATGSWNTGGFFNPTGSHVDYEWRQLEGGEWTYKQHFDDYSWWVSKHNEKVFEEQKVIQQYTSAGRDH